MTHSSLTMNACRPVGQSDGRGWRWMSLGLALIVAVPLLTIVLEWFVPSGDVWRHLAETQLPELLTNTLKLLLGVAAGVFILGVSLAWFTVMYEFPGRRLFEWALMLPLAMPAYVLAFVTIGIFDFSGPVQAVLISIFGVNGFWFPEIRSTGGVIFVMVLALYPYVYMLARSAFMSQGRTLLEAARISGASPARAFFRVALPMARPAIAAGISLALMETLADFGAVSAFNFDTFTTAIYKAWFGLFNLSAAAQLASILLLFAFMALFIERKTRSRSRYHTSEHHGINKRPGLEGKKRWFVFAYASLVLLLAFILPLIQLSTWALQVIEEDLDSRYFMLAEHTLMLGGGTALLAVTAAFILGFTKRYYPSPASRVSVSLGTLGYALPGSVLAVGVMLSFTWMDDLIERVASWFNMTPEFFLTGSLVGLVLAYLVRFMAVSFGPVDSALERIKPSIREAARSLGASRTRIVWQIYLPLLRPGLLTGFLLVFVDVMKEMPATLLLRPFGWDTFAVRIFEMTSEGEWERASLPALSLVVIGLIPVLMLVRSIRQHKSRQTVPG